MSVDTSVNIGLNLYIHIILFTVHINMYKLYSFPHFSSHLLQEIDKCNQIEFLYVCVIVRVIVCVWLCVCVRMCKNVYTERCTNKL